MIKFSRNVRKRAVDAAPFFRAVPCTLAWDILGGCAVGGFACPVGVTKRGMRLLAEAGVTSGESGAVTAGLLDALAEPQSRPIRDELGLDRNSVVLLISTESDTDPANYREIVEGADGGARA